MDDSLLIKKVHIKTLITLLIDLYDMGVDFVDIGGEKDPQQDVIKISYTEEYVNVEGENDEKEFYWEIDKDDNDEELSDNKLNDLI